MSREIRFRAWDNINKKYIPHEYLECCIKNINKNNSGKKQFDYEQYTGLKDKNGVEIYEGDIVNVIDGEGNYYKNKDINFNLSWGRYVIGENLTLTSGIAKKCEIVGNTHENEDLLK